MSPLLAEAAQSAASWNVVEVIAVLVALVISGGTLIRSYSGKSGERQIEPTQIAALRDDIAALQTTLNSFNRELGEGRVIAAQNQQALRDLAQKQDADIAGAHKRIDAIDREVAAHAARINAIERQCPKC